MILDFGPQFELQSRRARDNDPRGQFRLALLYNLGLGVAQSYPKALEWYLAAARNGSVEAQSNLGYMHATGRGVPQDFVEAHAWYSVAAASGNETARRNRDALSHDMTPGQVERAQARSKRHLASVVNAQTAGLADGPGGTQEP